MPKTDDAICIAVAKKTLLSQRPPSQTKKACVDKLRELLNWGFVFQIRLPENICTILASQTYSNENKVQRVQQALAHYDPRHFLVKCFDPRPTGLLLCPNHSGPLNFGAPKMVWYEINHKKDLSVFLQALNAHIAKHPLPIFEVKFSDQPCPSSMMALNALTAYRKSIRLASEKEALQKQNGAQKYVMAKQGDVPTFLLCFVVVFLGLWGTTFTLAQSESSGWFANCIAVASVWMLTSVMAVFVTNNTPSHAREPFGRLEEKEPEQNHRDVFQFVLQPKKAAFQLLSVRTYRHLKDRITHLLGLSGTIVKISPYALSLVAFFDIDVMQLRSMPMLMSCFFMDLALSSQFWISKKLMDFYRKHEQLASEEGIRGFCWLFPAIFYGLVVVVGDRVAPHHSYGDRYASRIMFASLTSGALMIFLPKMKNNARNCKMWVRNAVNQTISMLIDFGRQSSARLGRCHQNYVDPAMQRLTHFGQEVFSRSIGFVRASKALYSYFDVVLPYVMMVVVLQNMDVMHQFSVPLKLAFYWGGQALCFETSLSRLKYFLCVFSLCYVGMDSVFGNKIVANHSLAAKNEFLWFLSSCMSMFEMYFQCGQKALELKNTTVTRLSDLGRRCIRASNMAVTQFSALACSLQATRVRYVETISATLDGIRESYEADFDVGAALWSQLSYFLLCVLTYKSMGNGQGALVMYGLIAGLQAHRLQPELITIKLDHLLHKLPNVINGYTTESPVTMNAKFFEPQVLTGVMCNIPPLEPPSRHNFIERFLNFAESQSPQATLQKLIGDIASRFASHDAPKHGGDHNLIKLFFNSLLGSQTTNILGKIVDNGRNLDKRLEEWASACQTQVKNMRTQLFSKIIAYACVFEGYMPRTIKNMHEFESFYASTYLAPFSILIAASTHGQAWFNECVNAATKAIIETRRFNLNIKRLAIRLFKMPNQESYWFLRKFAFMIRAKSVLPYKTFSVIISRLKKNSELNQSLPFLKKLDPASDSKSGPKNTVWTTRYLYGLLHRMALFNADDRAMMALIASHDDNTATIECLTMEYVTYNRLVGIDWHTYAWLLLEANHREIKDSDQKRIATHQSQTPWFEHFKTRASNSDRKATTLEMRIRQQNIHHVMRTIVEVIAKKRDHSFPAFRRALFQKYNTQKTPYCHRLLNKKVYDHESSLVQINAQPSQDNSAGAFKKILKKMTLPAWLEKIFQSHFGDPQGDIDFSGIDMGKALWRLYRYPAEQPSSLSAIISALAKDLKKSPEEKSREEVKDLKKSPEEKSSEEAKDLKKSPEEKSSEEAKDLKKSPEAKSSEEAKDAKKSAEVMPGGAWLSQAKHLKRVVFSGHFVAMMKRISAHVLTRQHVYLPKQSACGRDAQQKTFDVKNNNTYKHAYGRDAKQGACVVPPLPLASYPFPVQLPVGLWRILWGIFKEAWQPSTSPGIVSGQARAQSSSDFKGRGGHALPVSQNEFKFLNMNGKSEERRGQRRQGDASFS